jgi:xanthine dehydrogenase molybdenum-binding subunit
MLDPIFDKAARRLDIDRVAIRRLNAPGRNARFGAQSLTSAYVHEAFDQGRALFKWEEQKKLSRRQRGSRVTGVGVGLGCFSAGTVGFDGLLLIKPDGKLYIHTGCGNLGTESYSDTSRVAAEVLGMPWEKCELVWGYTSKNLPWSPPQAGSQTTFAHSRANYAAASDAKRKLQEIAARDLGGSPDDYELGNERVYQKANPSRRLSYAQAARRAIELGGKFSGHELAGGLNPMTIQSAQALAGQGLLGVEKDRLPHAGMTVSFVVGFARIELDLETGRIDILDYIAVADCGTVVNPRGLGGQIHGGAVQGFGIARSQKWILDPRWGASFSRSLYRAKPPTILDIPLEMKWGAVDMADPFNPVGAKGIGEPPVAAGATAVLNAIADALGKEAFNRSPVTTDMIVNALESLPQPFDAFAAHV